MKFSFLDTGKLFKNKKVTYSILGVVSIVSLLFFGVALNYYLLARSVELPEIFTPGEVTNEQIIFKSEDLFGARINNEFIEASQSAGNLWEIELPEISGKYEYELFGISKNRFFTLESPDTIVGAIEADFERPVVQADNLESMYNEPNIVLDLELNEDVQIEINEEVVSCNQSNFTYSCDLEFEDEGEQNIMVKLTDKAGNVATQEFKTIYTPLPELECNEDAITTPTSADSFTLQCTTNKEGIVTAQSKEYNPIPEEIFEIPIQLSSEGVSNIFVEFKDTYDLLSNVEFDVEKDSTPPEAEFTFLDSKKLYLDGYITIKLKSNEDANATVKMYPLNNYFETDEIAKQILNSGNFQYQGGETFVQELAAGTEYEFSTINNFALCQIISDSNKNCFSPTVAAIEITLKDSLGNESKYLCNNWIASETALLDGLEATTCQPR